MPQCMVAWLHGGTHNHMLLTGSDVIDTVFAVDVGMLHPSHPLRESDVKWYLNCHTLMNLIDSL